MIYVFCFFISIFIVWLSSRIKNNKIRTILSLMGVFIPCLLAGIRANSVGTDVEVYLTSLFDLAKNSNNFVGYLNSSYFNGWRNVVVKEFEIGFVLLVYLIVKLTKNIHVLLFCIQLLIILPIYMGIKKIKGNDSLSVALLSFYMLMYNFSLNAMRQCIAISIVFLGFSYLINKKNVKLMLCVLVAFMFHKSAVIGVFLYLAYKFLNLKNTEERDLRQVKYWMKLLPFVVVPFLCVVFVEQIAIAMEFIGLDKYAAYISGDFKWGINQFIIRAPILIAILINYENLNKKFDARFYLMVVICDILCWQLVSINPNAARIGSYFSVFYVLVYSDTFDNKNFGYKSLVSKVIMFSYLLIYWTYAIYYKNANETIPYIPFF